MFFPRGWIERLTRWWNEREQHLPEYRDGVHEIVHGGWRGCLASTFAVVVVAAAHGQRFRELLLPGAGACEKIGREFLAPVNLM